jgi:hypothetical protein
MYPTDHAGQYTSSSARALPREPEAVTPEDVSKFSLEARQRTAKRVAAQDAQDFTGSIGERIDRSLQEAKRVGMDVSGVEWALNRKAQQLEHRTKKAA